MGSISTPSVVSKEESAAERFVLVGVVVNIIIKEVGTVPAAGVGPKGDET